MKKSKTAIKNQLERIDWNSVLRLSSSEFDLSLNLLFQKINKLINFWVPLHVQANTRKISQNKPWITKGVLKSIVTKNRLYNKVCRLTDPLKWDEIACKVKNYKKKLSLKLTRASKANHFNKSFTENKLNLFKT